MTDSQEADPSTAGAGIPAGPVPSRWPDVIGAIGIVLSAIIFIDKLDDLLTLTWTQEQWRGLVGADLANLIVDSLPPLAVRLVTSLAHMALAVLLLAGCLALRRRRRAGIARCRVWAALAIVWVTLEIGWAAWWLSQRTEEITRAAGVSPAAWQGYAAFGIAVALVLLLAFPVFLLIWFARRDVKAEYETWPA
jgi:hypothetical protein